MTDQTVKPPPRKWCLRAEPRGAKKTQNGVLTPVAGRKEQLELIPDQMLGKTYGEISERAVVLNEKQLMAGFLDYLYCPEVTR